MKSIFTYIHFTGCPIHNGRYRGRCVSRPPKLKLMTETTTLNHEHIHILRTHHLTSPINTCIMCLRGKGEKSFICIFLAFSQEIWTEENNCKIINKLCGGVEMVCICVYTPDDAPFWKDTHCVLGLDDNGN